MRVTSEHWRYVATVLSATIHDGRAELHVSAPIVEGPSPSWLDELAPLDGSKCSAETPDVLVADGSPAILPDQMTPVAS